MEQVNNQEFQSQIPEAKMNTETIKKVMSFLCLFISETLVKRLVSMILISVGIPNAQITELTGYCDRSVRGLRKELSNGVSDKMFHVGGGGGKSKLEGIEGAIIKEITDNVYQSQQQIVDMVEAKFGIKTSTSAIQRLLKKTV